MAAPDDILYEYAVIRFVPRVDREEFINVGLIMMNKRRKWMKASVIIDEERVKSLFPNVDIDCLKNQSRLFEMTDVPDSQIPVEEKYRWLTAVKSACLQVSASHPGLLAIETYDAESLPALMEEEFSRLFSLLIL